MMLIFICLVYPTLVNIRIFITVLVFSRKRDNYHGIRHAFRGGEKFTRLNRKATGPTMFPATNPALWSFLSCDGDDCTHLADVML